MAPSAINPGSAHTWVVVSTTIGGIAYGALVTLGTMCLVTLHSTGRRLNQGRALANQHYYFWIHVLLLLTIATFLQIWDVRMAVYYANLNLLAPSWDWSNVGIVVATVLTDGLLVWRCYMVQKAVFLNRPAGLHNICWILPLMLLVVVVVSGMIAVALSNPNHFLFHSDTYRPTTTWTVVALGSNVALNLFGTTNIVVRLLLQRRSIITPLGRSSALAKRYKHTSSILLESAALNIPVAVVSIAFLLAGEDFLLIALAIVFHGQSIASILLIYQVAKARALDLSQREEAVTSDPAPES